MPGVLVKDALVIKRNRHRPFLSVEDLVARVGSSTEGDCRKFCSNPSHVTEPLEGHSVFDDRKTKRPTPRTTDLSLFVLSAFGNSGFTKDGK